MAKWLVRWNLDLAEYWCGELLQWTFIARAERRGPDDFHEARHIMSSFEAGDSSDCTDENCRLVGITLVSSAGEASCSIITARDQKYEDFGHALRRAAPEGWRGRFTHRTFILSEIKRRAPTTDVEQSGREAGGSHSDSYAFRD